MDARGYERLLDNLAEGLAGVGTDAQAGRWDRAEQRIRAMDAVPSFKGYHGFSGSICASINNEVATGRKIKGLDIFMA